MTTIEAIEVLKDTASRWAENAEEGLPSRISPEMCTNEELFANFTSELDEYEREDAELVRDVWRACDLLTKLVKEGGIN